MTFTTDELAALYAGVIEGRGDVDPMLRFSDLHRELGDDDAADAWAWLARKRRWANSRDSWWPASFGSTVLGATLLPIDLIPDDWEDQVVWARESQNVWDCVISEPMLHFVRRWREWSPEVRAALWKWEPGE